MKEIFINIFRIEGYVIDDLGRQAKYHIEFKNGFYLLFVQRRKGKKGKWTTSKILEKSTKPMFLEYNPQKKTLKALIVA